MAAEDVPAITRPSAAAGLRARVGGGVAHPPVFALGADRLTGVSSPAVLDVAAVVIVAHQ